MKGIHILICQRVCKAVSQGISPLILQQAPYCHLHPQLLQELSTGALLYAFHQKPSYKLFFVGLMLCDWVLHHGYADQQKKAIEILISAVQLEPSFDTPELALLIQRLLQNNRRSA